MSLEIVLKYRGAHEDSFRRTVEDRKELAARLARVPEIEHVFESQLGDGDAYLRLAVRLPEENARLVDALAAELTAVAVPPTPSAHRDLKTWTRVGVEG